MKAARCAPPGEAPLGDRQPRTPWRAVVGRGQCRHDGDVEGVEEPPAGPWRSRPRPARCPRRGRRSSGRPRWIDTDCRCPESADHARTSTGRRDGAATRRPRCLASQASGARTTLQPAGRERSLYLVLELLGEQGEIEGNGMPPSIVRPCSARPTAVSKSCSILSAGTPRRGRARHRRRHSRSRASGQGDDDHLAEARDDRVPS